MEEPVKKTFTEHVLNFDDATKCEMMNIGQYVVLAIIPVLLLNKLIQVYSPDPDESKHSAEIGLEVISQVIVLFLGMMFIHRLITFVPTYSGEEYPAMNVLTPALSFLVIVLSIQSRLGEKVNILYERFMDILGYGEQKQQSPVRTSQPIAGTPMHHQGPIQHPSSSQIPSYDIRGEAQQSMHQSSDYMPSPQPQQAPQPSAMPDYGMGQGQGQGQVGDMMFQEPMAANDAFGGFGGVAF